MLNSDWARNPAQMWRIYLQSTCLKHCFPASFVPWPLLVSTNNHGFSYPCSRKCSVRRIFFFMAQQPLVGQGLLLIGASRSHSIRHTALGRNPLDKWSAQRRDPNLITHNTHKTHIHDPGVIRTHNPSKHAATDPRLRLHSHWDQLGSFIST